MDCNDHVEEATIVPEEVNFFISKLFVRSTMFVGARGSEVRHIRSYPDEKDRPCQAGNGDRLPDQ